MTLYTTSGFVFVDVTAFRMSKSLSANQISSRYLYWRLRYNYFRFRNTNVRHVGILLPVSYLFMSLPSEGQSLSANQISSRYLHWRACLGGAVGSVTVRAACMVTVIGESGFEALLARSLCQVIAVYALRLNSLAGTEGSTVSSFICDCWLILGSETLSISRCLNH